MREGLAMEGQTAAEQGQAGRWLLLPETRRSGRRSRPPTPPRERLRLLKREDEEERLRRCWPVREAPDEAGAARGEEEERPLPLANDLDMTRLEDMSEDCCT